MNKITSTPIEGTEEKFLDYYLGDTPEEAEELYKKFSHTLNQISNSYSRMSGLPREDLFGSALTGLARAVRDYDPDRGGKFKTYAIYRIKNALNDYIRCNFSIVKIPTQVQTANSYINSIKSILSRYSLDYEGISDLLSCDYVDPSIEGKDRKVIDKYLSKLHDLADRHNLNYENLIRDSEYVPAAYELDDTAAQEDILRREEKMLDAALLVSKLKDHMDITERAVAESIMAGKTYVEIAKEHGKSATWVFNVLKRLKAKLLEVVK